MYSASVDPDHITVLSAVDQTALELGIPWFLCGAYSRVLLCEEALGTPVGRATNDLDIAVCVESLDAFTPFLESICRAPGFQQDSRMEQRLIHSSGIRLDFIPFGTFAEPSEMYNWGAENAFKMNVRGFHDACSSAVRILLNGQLEVKSAGFAEQFVLKLFAWRDRRLFRGVDDASDLAYFLRNALQSISEDYLYRRYDAVLQETEYDIDLASCFALGRRIASVFSRRNAEKVFDILSSELQDGDESALISDMYGSFASWPQPEERISAIVHQVLKGLSPVKD